MRNNAERMKYPEYRKAGLLVTSSWVESLIKEINYRVKGTEKFWNEHGAESILAVRAAALCDDERLAKHEKRKEKIYGLIAERPSSGYEIAQAIWGNVAVTQAFLTLSEVIGHMDLLEAEGRVRVVDDGSVIRFEAVA